MLNSAKLWIVSAFVLVASQVAGQTIIDDFSDAGLNTQDPPGLTRTTVGVTTVTDAGLSGVIGGARTMTLEMTVARWRQSRSSVRCYHGRGDLDLHLERPRGWCGRVCSTTATAQGWLRI